jgi:uncharacterized pyridoxamine 5'-phosphate oxidase family protein
MEEEAMTGDPIVELDAGFSAEDGRATPWATALELLKAEVFWLSTVRADGRPHVTPLVAVWLDGALYFCTGEGEQKERNIQRNPHCILTTGCNSLDDGFDLVVEGDAVPVRDERLRRIADAYETNYGSDWRFGVRDGVFVHGPDEGSVAFVYEVAPETVFGFRKGDEFSQTRWRFRRD